MIRIFPRLFFITSFWISSIQAVPAYLDLLKAEQPGTHPNCITCHGLSPGSLPNNQNVTERGRLLYIQIKRDAEQFNVINAGQSFTEAPDFIVFGDTRTNDSVHKEIVKKICEENPKAVFHTGDIVADGSHQPQWDNAVKIQDCLIKDKRIFPVCGNHEGKHCLKNPFKAALGIDQPFYAKEFKGFTFLALNSEDQTKEQLNWLKSLPTGKRYIPYFHHVIYPTIAGHSANDGLLNEYVPEFKRLGVKVAFNGHNHGYDRAVVDGIQYVTVGGGGAPLYPCGPKKSYTQACLSDYGYLRCKVSKRSSFECVSVRTNGDVVDTFKVHYP